MWIESGEMTADGRMKGWPTALPDPDGVSAFIFVGGNGEIVEGPEDLVIQMQACAEYAAANKLKVEQDWITLLKAREEWARQAAIEAAKPKPPYQPPVFLKLEWQPGSGTPGVLRETDEVQ
jgi:hypothetical protein